MSDRTETREAFDLGAAAGRAASYADFEGGAVVLPDGYSLQSVEHLQERPNRAVAHPRFREATHFAAYVSRFRAGVQPAIFSDPERMAIHAVLDHHEVLPVEEGEERDFVAARHGVHKATFSARFSDEYAAWRRLHRKPQSQRVVGEFLEDRAVDIVTPAPADVMDMIMQFDALKKVTFRQAQRLRDGMRQVTYHEEDEARGALTLPEAFVLRVPVYEGAEAEEITVRLRFRIEDGALTFTFVIAQIERLEADAFADCEAAVLAAIEGPPIPIWRAELSGD